MMTTMLLFIPVLTLPCTSSSTGFGCSGTSEVSTWGFLGVKTAVALAKIFQREVLGLDTAGTWSSSGISIALYGRSGNSMLF